ncbi:MAG: ABC transporter [Dactylosporangium sp.]|nr:50S ribosome-binding GTPase [Dactylosporangium sp.]NNJ60175.1 ABC transporter [Dactylosporangium sp.]
MTTEPSAATGQATAQPVLAVRHSDLQRLVTALTDLMESIAGTRYPLALPSAPDAMSAGNATVAELNDYLLPRVLRLDGPLLAVVGGSTGVGKSTLVNSLVGTPVSSAGVLRPTTRTPVLAHSPADGSWFAGGDHLTVTAAPALAPGLAILDAPDIDSVVQANRSLASRLLAAADMWLFVTTAARYADAVPWELLRKARNRATATALVLNRVPEGARAELTTSLSSLLTTHDLDTLPLFIIPESDRDSQGLLAPDRVAPLLRWLGALADDEETRTTIVRQTVGGAIDLLEPTVTGLAAAADDQTTAAAELTAAVQVAHDGMRSRLATVITDGALLRGDLLARWQSLAGTNDLFRILPTRIGRIPERIGWVSDRTGWLRHHAGRTRDTAAHSRERAAALVGRGGRISRLRQALETSLSALLCDTALAAAERVRADWLAHPAGPALLAGVEDPSAASQALAARVRTVVGYWWRAVGEFVDAEARKEPAGRRIGPHAIAVSTTLTCVLACSGPTRSTTDASSQSSEHPMLAALKVLETVFGQAATALVTDARTGLLTKIDAFLASEAAGQSEVLAAHRIDPAIAGRLRALAREVTIARLCAGLPAARTAPATLPPVDPPDGQPAPEETS